MKSAWQADCCFLVFPYVLKLASFGPKFEFENLSHHLFGPTLARAGFVQEAVADETCAIRTFSPEFCLQSMSVFRTAGACSGCCPVRKKRPESA
jgi:hypothetical protein